MASRVRMLVVLSSAMAILAIAGSAPAAEKSVPPAAASQAKPVAPVTVNVTVNVRVSHDTNIDVRIEAPVTPVIGSIQIPDFVQNLLTGFLKPSSPTQPKPASPLIPTLPPSSTAKPAASPDKK